MAKYVFTKEMKDSHPSICHSCEHACKPSALSLAEKGFVGCWKHLGKMNERDVDPETAALEILSGGTVEAAALGWVTPDNIDSDFDSGHMYNFVLMTKGCRKCPCYRMKDTRR